MFFILYDIDKLFKVMCVHIHIIVCPKSTCIYCKYGFLDNMKVHIGKCEWKYAHAIDRILNSLQKGFVYSKQYLIKWKGYPTEYNTWDSISHLRRSKILNKSNNRTGDTCSIVLSAFCCDIFDLTLKYIAQGYTVNGETTNICWKFSG